VADTAFLRTTGDVADHIRAPVKSGQVFQETAEDMAERLAFDRELLSCHQAAEWGMRTIQGSFGHLQLPLNINNPAGRSNLLKVCVRLSNLRAQQVGISQIRNTFVPIWKEGEQEQVWDKFEGMLFGDIR